MRRGLRIGERTGTTQATRHRNGLLFAIFMQKIVELLARLYSIFPWCKDFCKDYQSKFYHNDVNSAEILGEFQSSAYLTECLSRNVFFSSRSAIM